MSETDILNGLAETLGEIIGQGSVRLESSTRQEDVEGWDSLAQIQLVLALGKRFGVKFTTREVMGWTDVGSIVACIRGKCA